jgi:hypothetical protein
MFVPHSHIGFHDDHSPVRTASTPEKKMMNMIHQKLQIYF